MNVKKPFLHLLAVAGLLFGARLVFELSVAADFVFRTPGHSTEFFAFGLAAILIALCFVIVLTIIRLNQKVSIETVLMILLLPLPFVPLPFHFDAAYWKFILLHKDAYIRAIEEDQSPPPKYKIFSWGNENTGLGGGFVERVIVYDESDDISRITGPEPFPGVCRWHTEAFGDHFYYVTRVCS